MKRWTLGWLCVLLASVSLTVVAGSAPVPVEASMLLTGSIVVAPDGRVRSHAIDQAEKLTPAIAAFVDQAVATWRFEPVLLGGKPVAAEAKMNVRLVATPGDDDQLVVRVKGASFGDGGPGERISYAAGVPRDAPKYPRKVAEAGAGGTVYLMLKVGTQGEVMEVAIAQVNLTVYGPEQQMASLRKELADSSVAAAKRWKFDLPTVGKEVNDPPWYANVPVIFNLCYRGKKSLCSQKNLYGKWERYVPGPYTPASWMSATQLAANNVDTLPDGGVMGGEQALRLLSSL